MCGEDPDYAKRDLWEHIEQGNTCNWTLKIQTMTPEEATQVDFDPFDVTKVRLSLSLSLSLHLSRQPQGRPEHRD